jgi:hypothetical protein
MKNQVYILCLVLTSALVRPVLAASSMPHSAADKHAVPVSAIVKLPLQDARPRAATDLPLDNFMSYLNLSQAFHYLDGGSATVTGLKEQRKLAQPTPAAKRVSEPASEVLLLAGLSALAIAIRRQSPS